MSRLGHWMLSHPWALGWLAVMVLLSLGLDLLGVESVRDLEMTR